MTKLNLTARLYYYYLFIFIFYPFDFESYKFYRVTHFGQSITFSFKNLYDTSKNTYKCYNR